VVDQALSGHTTAGTVGASLSRVDVASSTLATASALSTAQSDLTAIKGAGFTGGVDDLHSAHTLQATLATSAALATAQSGITTIVGYGAPPSAATVSAAVVDQALSGHTTAGTVGEALSRADVATSTRLAASSYTAPPSAATISTQVNADITTAHGAGSYQTASTAGLATATDVSNGTAAVQAYGDLHWTTATGFAVPGDAMALTVGERSTLTTSIRQAINVDHGAGLYLTATGFAVPGDAMALIDDAITAAKIANGAIGVTEAPLLAHLDADVSSRLATSGYTAPPSAGANAAAVWATVESTGVDGTMGGSLWKTRRRLTQRASTSVLGVVTLYQDDNVTPETTFTLTDVDGNAVTIVAGDPARRSAET
jgi:hypothetical protein